MQTAVQLRTDLVATIAHLRAVTLKVRTNSGPTKAFSAPDSHKIAEGLFLSVVTHWEEFCQALIISDLALQTSSSLRKDVSSFKSGAARDRVTEMIATHIDHPNAFYDWSDFSKVHARALTLLHVPNRFNVVVPAAPPAGATKNQSALHAFTTDLSDFKTIRNAIAHKSDKAWDSFMRLVLRAPYGLTSSQRRGITPGRFVIAHTVGGDPILIHTLNRIEQAAFVLVP